MVGAKNLTVLSSPVIGDAGFVSSTRISRACTRRWCVPRSTRFRVESSRNGCARLCIFWITSRAATTVFKRARVPSDRLARWLMLLFHLSPLPPPRNCFGADIRPHDDPTALPWINRDWIFFCRPIPRQSHGRRLYARSNSSLAELFNWHTDAASACCCPRQSTTGRLSSSTIAISFFSLIYVCYRPRRNIPQAATNIPSTAHTSSSHAPTSPYFDDFNSPCQCARDNSVAERSIATEARELQIRTVSLLRLSLAKITNNRPASRVLSIIDGGIYISHRSLVVYVVGWSADARKSGRRSRREYRTGGNFACLREECCSFSARNAIFIPDWYNSTILAHQKFHWI